jgi:hypothetical protein
MEMRLSRRDYYTIAAVVVLIAVLAFGTGRGKGKPIPLDDRHRPSYDAINGGKSHVEIELICTTCHSKSSLPLPQGHPPKEQCLICHKLLPA